MALFLILLASTAALGGAVFVVARRSCRWGNCCAGLALALLCGKAILHAMPHWEWAVFPWPGYAYLQSFLLYPIAVAFFFAAAPRLPVQWNQMVVCAAGLLLLAHGARESSWIAWPEAHGEERYADGSGHLQQSTQYTCGPCACVSAVSYFGLRISERTMAGYCLTGKRGSPLFSLYRGIEMALAEGPHRAAIRDLGCRKLIEEDRVAVIERQGGGHAVCIRGQGDHVKVHDPLLAEPFRWTPAELERAYRGPAVVIEPR